MVKNCSKHGNIVDKTENKNNDNIMAHGKDATYVEKQLVIKGIKLTKTLSLV